MTKGLAPTDSVTRADEGPGSERGVILLPTQAELAAGRERMVDDIAEVVLVRWDDGRRRWERVADLRRIP